MHEKRVERRVLGATYWPKKDDSMNDGGINKQDEALVNRRQRHVFLMKPDGSSEDLFEVTVSRTALDYSSELNITWWLKNLRNYRI